MKRVGIMSMQRIHNYGSFLQAYALKSVIESMGYNVEFVDYHIGEPLIQNNEIKGILRKLLKVFEILKYKAKLSHKFAFIKHKKNFGKKYLKYLDLSKYNYNPKLDTLVIGSDEVFNCIQSNKNVGYSLELFGFNNNANRLISYAASFGNTTIEKIEKYNKFIELQNCFKFFNAISVRDLNSKNIIKKLGFDSTLCIDPVLLYDYSNFELIPSLNIKDKYLLLYAYSGRITVDEACFIKKYASSKGLKIYTIGGVQYKADKFIDCSPFEVLAYFKNAEEIITDTFHGTIFSIINKKKFATLIRKSVGDNYGNEEKLTYLLEIFDLSSRIVDKIENLNIILKNNIDYCKVFETLNKLRLESLSYIKENL